MTKIRYAFIVLLCLMLVQFFPTTLRAEAVGSWRIYPSYNTIEDIEPAGNNIFVMASSNLYLYNTGDDSVTAYDKSSGLTDTNLKKISWNQTAKRLILVYGNSNIDLLSTNGDVINISDLFDKQMTGDKTVNNFTHNGQHTYLATNFGIVKIDVKNGYIADSYVLNKKIKQVAFFKDYIYALTATEGIIRAKLTANLNDPASWQSFTRASFDYIFTLNGQLIVMSSDNECTINTETAEVNRFGTFTFHWAKMYNDRILCGAANFMTEISSDLKCQTSTASYDINVVAFTNGGYWSNNADNKLVRYALSDNTFMPQTTGVMPDGPASNHSYRLCISNDRVYVTAGLWTEANGNLSYPGQVLVLEDDKWSQFENEGVAALSGGRYNDVISLDVDPRDPEHVMVAGFNGLYEFRSGKCVRRYGVADGLLTYDDNPSKDYHVIVSALKYESNGDLWVFNSHTPRPVAILHADGSWSYLQDMLEYTGGTSHENDLKGITIDGDNMWFVNSWSNHGTLFKYDRKKQKLSYTTSFFNQDATPYSFSAILDSAIDRYGNIWIGTIKGPFYIKPEDQETMLLTQHKVPRNDGTNYADYLLSGIKVQSIAIDGGNRKWIGTGSNGVFLISDDCNTQIAHFTTENSPLKSDNVYDIAIDGKTGRVYFATDNGLCSYMSDATQSVEELDDSQATVFPNPVTPEYTGYITVTGLEYDSQVIITTATGQKVAEGRSNGGSFAWDGYDLNGNRVASGVYMVLVAKKDGGSGIAAKIAIVR